jgi:rhamnosyltransferase
MGLARLALVQRTGLVAADAMSSPIQTVAAVVVCFHPEPQALRALVQSLMPDVKQVWLINNGPQGSLGVDWGEGVACMDCGGNAGVAAALNMGFEQAFAHGADAVIGFDQDSQPTPGLASQLREHWNREIELRPHARLGGLGPTLRDSEANHHLHSFAPYNWLRRRVWALPGACHEVDHLITSGCLISQQAWREIGGMNASLFIDWVDVEWCGRARHAGYQLLMDGDAVLVHRIGARSQALLGRHFHVHAPFRHYFVLRNALIIWRDKRFALGWRTHHVFYATRIILANLLFAPHRVERLHCVWRGFLDGVMRRTGAQGQVPSE